MILLTNYVDIRSNLLQPFIVKSYCYLLNRKMEVLGASVSLGTMLPTNGFLFNIALSFFSYWLCLHLMMSDLGKHEEGSTFVDVDYCDEEYQEIGLWA